MKYRALAVDDEAAMQKLVMRALKKQDIQCDAAVDGNEAEVRVSHGQYNAVVTDLRMPNKHGHALATYLLTLEPRPVIVVHTGVVEPRLIEDLLARGVDEIIFKPSDFSMLAAKVRELVERRFPQKGTEVSLAKPVESTADSVPDSLSADLSDTLYPRQYDKLVRNCHLSGESLLEQERATFPLSHTEVLSHLLDGWHIPGEVQSPLRRMLDDYSALVKLPEPLRMKTEFVKLAAFVSRMAMGRWESWDGMDAPPAPMLKRLGITNLNQVIEQTKTDLMRLAAF